MHKAQVDKEIIVNNNLKLRGILTKTKLFNDEVISRILKRPVFKYTLLIKFIGKVLKNIIVPNQSTYIFTYTINKNIY